MIEVTRSQIKWTLTSTDDCRGLEIVGQIIIPHHQFIKVEDEIYQDEGRYSKAYEKAEQVHERLFGYRKYTGYDHFRSEKCKLRK